MLAKKGKRVLAVLLAVCMVMGLIGTGAWAVETPNGTYEGSNLFEYHLTKSLLEEMLSETEYGYNDVSGTTLVFPSSERRMTKKPLFKMFYATFSGIDALEEKDPNNIVQLNLYFDDGETLVIDRDQLVATLYKPDSPVPFYELSLGETAPETWVVTFDADNGDETVTQTVDNGECVIPPADPEKEGFDFLGWFADGENEPFQFEENPIYGDLTLTAKWEEHIVTPPEKRYTAQFFLRLDKTIAYEDGATGYNKTFYTPHGLMKGAISGTEFVVDGDKTGEAIIKDGVVNGDDLRTLVVTFAPVKAVIVEGPSTEALNGTLIRYFDVTQEQIDSGEVGVLWYVSKTGNDNCPYHVDGVVYNVESGAPVAPKETTYAVKHVYRTDGEVSGSMTVKGIKGVVGETVNVTDADKQPVYNGGTYQFTKAEPKTLTLDGSGSQTMTFYYDRKGEVDPPVKEYDYMVGYNFVDLLNGADTSQTYYLQSDGSLAKDDDTLVTDQKTLTVSSLTPAQYPKEVSGGTWNWGGEKDRFDHSNLAYESGEQEEQHDPKSTEAVLQLGTGKGAPTVTFTYIRARYTVTTSIDNGGAITGAGTYEKGENATVAFEPAEGYHVTGVAVDGKAYTEDEIAQANGSVAFDSISKAHSVTVTTAKDDAPPAETEYTVTYQYTGSVPEGMTAPAGGSYAAGVSVDQPANPTAPANYTFDGWVYPDGVELKDGQFAMPEKNIVITGNWTYTAPVVPDTPGGDSGDPIRYYQVTVEYLEEGTGNALAEAYTTDNIRLGRSYNVSKEAAKAIPGYTITDVDGEPEGKSQKDLTITVWYAKDGGNDGGEIEIIDPNTPTGDRPELPDEPEIEITDTDTPTGDRPETPDETVIVDGEVPMGNLPQTGTVAKAVEPRWTLGVLALLASMAAAGLAVTVSRRREEEAE